MISYPRLRSKSLMLIKMPYPQLKISLTQLLNSSILVLVLHLFRTGFKCPEIVLLYILKASEKLLDRGVTLIYLPISKLEEGMVLARNIPSANLNLPFAVTGYKLNTESLQKMRERGIQGAYIENPMTDGIEPQNFVEPELKNQMLNVIKKSFDQSLRHSAFNPASEDFHEIASLSESIVMNILTKDKLLFQMIDIRDYDNYTYSHSLYVGFLSVLLGTQLGLNDSCLRELALSGLLHDIGKTEIPLEITNKQGPLTYEEFEIMKKHPVLSAEKLRNNSMFSGAVVAGVRSHHEKYNGTGYPDKLSKNEIPLYGRILAIADVYDALSSSRPYRKAWPPPRIFDYLTGCMDTQFDPDILVAFLNCVAAYPVGSLVQLSDGSTAVVKDNNPGFSLRPVIRILEPAERAGRDIDLSCECLNITILEQKDEDYADDLKHSCLL